MNINILQSSYLYHLTAADLSWHW